MWSQVQKHLDNEAYKSIKLPANHLTSPLQCLHTLTNTRQINERFNPDQPTKQSDKKGTINGRERKERENEKETEMRTRGKGTIQITCSDTSTG